MNENTEPTKDEVKAAQDGAARRKAEIFSASLRRMSNQELRAELATAEVAGDARAIKAIKATLAEKEVTDRQRIIRASERAIEACKRSGTPAQLAEEESRLEGYRNGGPLPESVR